MTAEPSYSLKLRRSYHHLVDLQDRIKGWLNGGNYLTICEPHIDGPHNYRIRVEIVRDPPHDDFSTIIGDCIQNLRSALDHLIFELSGSFSPGSKFADATQFPIVGDENRKGASGMGHTMFMDKRAQESISFIDPRARTIIEKLQPYKRGNNFKLDPLWQLQQLSNADKHRVLHTVINTIDGLAIDADSVLGKVDIRLIGVGTGEVKHNTIVAKFIGTPIAPHTKMDVNLAVILEIRFSDTPALISGEVVAVLGSIYNYVIKEVVPPLKAFL